MYINTSWTSLVCSPPGVMSDTILLTLATAFNHLKDDVHIALRTQLGDVAQIDLRIQACSRLLLQINQVRRFLLLLLTRNARA